MAQKAYLILENGRVFEGSAFGGFREGNAELVFTTNMTGYMETLTDPSYFGQYVIQTFPLIGNTGIIPADFESGKVYLKGYIVREWCRHPSNFRGSGELDTFLKEQGVAGIEGVDTRALTRIVREKGVMNARISASPELTPGEWEELRAYRITGAVPAATISEPLTTEPEGGGLLNIALWDFGSKDSIAKELVLRGARVTRVPAWSSASDILELRPDALMLSNGPGDPKDNPAIISDLAVLVKKGLPVMGVCLGHQLLALAMGADTGKMKFGHRGANQPVADEDTGRVYVTSQNHGYQVLAGSLPSFARPSMKNANDSTNEGVCYEGYPAFSVQFHPEACAGPLDTRFLFDKFIEMAGGRA